MIHIIDIFPFHPSTRGDKVVLEAEVPESTHVVILFQRLLMPATPHHCEGSIVLFNVDSLGSFLPQWEG